MLVCRKKSSLKIKALVAYKDSNNADNDMVIESNEKLEKVNECIAHCSVISITKNKKCINFHKDKPGDDSRNN